MYVLLYLLFTLSYLFVFPPVRCRTCLSLIHFLMHVGHVMSFAKQPKGCSDYDGWSVKSSKAKYCLIVPKDNSSIKNWIITFERCGTQVFFSKYFSLLFWDENVFFIVLGLHISFLYRFFFFFFFFVKVLTFLCPMMNSNI